MTPSTPPDLDSSEIAYSGTEIEPEAAPTNPQELKHSQYEKNRRGWRRIVVNFGPSWFTVTMGTGITSILLHNLPYHGRWLFYISVIIFCLNIAIFTLFSCISIVRYTYFRGTWSSILRHPAQAVFLGTIPVGLATIINMIVFVCVPAWGDKAAHLAWALWWIDIVMAMSCNLYIPHCIMRTEGITLNQVTPSWLFPVIADIVASGSGAIVANVLPNDQHAIWTVIVSYVLWGTSVPTALLIMAMYYNRLMIHDIIPSQAAVTSFIAIGPLGQGAAAIQLLGKVALKVFERNDFIPMAPIAGQFFYLTGILTALIMWGFAIVWLFFAIATIVRRDFKFNISWWAFTFPLGVFTVATTTLAQELPSRFFKVLGTIFSVVETLLWVMVACGTIKASLNGELFQPPPLEPWEKKEKKDTEEKNVEDSSV
ncbi:voltage-dependent anion channel [Fusarium flagelliforme]|uniref:voltage-dependent anion channel n=1 Tax=Fusarium flagelliforme TaxID=2675880 RepID=UPI001E8EBAB5|nr:voltage-dependent anion channel [Fusarium flagelliforme]KAH7189126.1 voltage-dependent anion channel [Fusarium flagelliforme]